jgi:2-polyprenyl-6-methoxyphenol hydroxylase-like FAD-dependent oxidoreductase
VTVVVRDQNSGETETVRADYLVAADGVHSRVRDSLGVTTRENGRPILGDVFVQQNARFGLAQQSRQRGLPIQEWRLRKSSPLCSIKSNA